MQILVVDDHALFREGLALVLQRLPGDVCVWEAGTAKEALRQLDLMPSADLVLVDIGLPGADGLELIGDIRARGIVCPLAVVSASDEIHLVHRAMAAGAQGFIPKATDSSTLLHGLEKILDGERWLPHPLGLKLRRTIDDLPRLSHRQGEILQALAEGDSNTEISRRLHISTHTVKFHLSALFRLLNARNRTECVIRARELGLLEQRSGQHED